VDGLPAHAQDGGDPLPAPALIAGVRDLELLYGLQEGAQRSNRAKPDFRVLAAGSGY
jgi:hypothetical protein